MGHEPVSSFYMLSDFGEACLFPSIEDELYCGEIFADTCITIKCSVYHDVSHSVISRYSLQQ